MGRIKLIMVLGLSLVLAAAASAEQSLWDLMDQAALELYMEGRYAEGASIAEKAVDVATKIFGPDSAEVATALNNLAMLHEAQGKYAEAEPLCRRSLTIWEKTLGREHPDVATSLGNIGILYQDRGNHGEALRMFEEALNILKRLALPSDQPQNLIANLYLDQEDIVKAEPVVTEAGYPPIRGRLSLMKRDFKGAKDHYERTRRSAEENRNANDLFIAYTGLAMAFEGLEDDIHAEEYYRKAIDFTEDLRSGLSPADR